MRKLRRSLFRKGFSASDAAGEALFQRCKVVGDQPDVSCSPYFIGRSDLQYCRGSKKSTSGSYKIISALGCEWLAINKHELSVVSYQQVTSFSNYRSPDLQFLACFQNACSRLLAEIWTPELVDNVNSKLVLELPKTDIE